jgi:protein TonB
MKKIFGIAASLILVIVSANAQSEKKEPPPPPPKPKDEIVKFTPPKIIKDEEVQVKAPSPPPKITIDEHFFKRNPTVSAISSQGNIISLKKKDGTIKKYDMNKKEEEKIFTERYGVSPIPPPPPPPKKVS